VGPDARRKVSDAGHRRVHGDCPSTAIARGRLVTLPLMAESALSSIKRALPVLTARLLFRQTTK
jgi:hypothetical protein